MVKAAVKAAAARASARVSAAEVAEEWAVGREAVVEVSLRRVGANEVRL